eukprot:TRINITY_DN29971_c0_g1_i1.p1 TRINITY_DN29971_c0_g1~~TRINITY_DN29971_c0_g1_i1.p1  ORF type:complete len:360 (-),score=52.63 TRINITY_DN29971_c0_g1_i1:131-1210(-)
MSCVFDRVFELREHPYLLLKVSEIVLELAVAELAAIETGLIQASVKLLVALHFFNERLTWDPVLEQSQVNMNAELDLSARCLSYKMSSYDPTSLNLSSSLVRSVLDPAWQPPPIDQSTDTSGLEEVMLVNQLPCPITYLACYDSESGLEDAFSATSTQESCSKKVLCDDSKRNGLSLLFRLPADSHGAPLDGSGNPVQCVSELPFYGNWPLNHTHLVPLAATGTDLDSLNREGRSVCIDYLYNPSQHCANLVVYAKHIMVNRSFLDLVVSWAAYSAQTEHERSTEPIILSDFHEPDPTISIALAASPDCIASFQVPLGIETMVGNAIDVHLKDPEQGLYHHLLCWVELGYGKCLSLIHI